ncbi:TldD/PmbA family protein [Streptomyces sp. AC536]|uniref:TldD/PmbA family protein n=1 Tax=Streptomyces buecherae TaxID=2763006 RepID=UPI00164E451C|nr:TldD/PmbA family protein [Streptomyces buecherae]MBC3987223.1 TldD/PmbA family protein [Streptomyces buecherae]QNJ43564.1 TldD/PmbA family protein [Streptomyces buecherae]
MSPAELFRDGEHAALAPVLRQLGPDTLALLRRGAMQQTALRGDAVTSTRHSTTGSALETVGPGARRHTFTGACSAAALRRLAEAAQGSGAATAPEAAGREALDAGDELPAEVATALPRLAGQLADRMLSGGPPGLLPLINADATRTRIAVLRADGTLATDDRLYLELRVGARIAGAPATARSLRIVSAASLELLLKGDRHLAAADEVVRGALARTDAVDPPEGELPVVLGPAGPAALLHEVCGHGLEADVACAPRGAYQDLLGRRVASPLVTVVDDPGMPSWAPLYRVDDEGRTAGPTTLIDRGVLASYLADAEVSRRTGHPATGNGRRLDHAHPALSRMSCTYLAAGQAPPEEALAGIRRGLYVRSVVTGETDMSGGEFTADVTESFLVENGRITAPVRSATLHGSGTDVLRQVDVVCDDLDFLAYGYHCNKQGQFPLKVSVGQPTLRIRALGVTGA